MTKHHSTGAQLVMLSGLKFWDQAVSLIKTMVIARMFSLTEYSTYTKMLLILDFAFAIIVLNLPSSANYFVAKAKDEEDRKDFIFTYYCLCTIVGIFLSALLVLIAPLMGELLNNSSIDTFKWFFAFTCLPQVITKATSYVLTSQGKSDVAVKISFASSVMTLVGLIIAFKSSNSFVVCLVVILAVEWIMTLVGYYVGVQNLGGLFKDLGNRANEDGKVRFRITYIRKIYAYIIPVGLSSLVLVINTRVDKVLVSLNCSDKFYAVYANASKELPIAALSVAIASVIIPKLVKFIKTNDEMKAIKIWEHALVFVSSISLLLLVGTFVFAPEVMTIIYSSKYLDGVSIFRVYLLLIPFHCIEYTLLLSAMGQTKYILRSSIISMIVNIILDFVLMYAIGVIGLGIATILATIVMVILQLYYTANLLKVKISDLVPINKLAVLLAINLLFGLAFKIIQRIIKLDTIISSVGEAIVLGAIWSIIYFLLIAKYIKQEWKGLNYGD